MYELTFEAIFHLIVHCNALTCYSILFCLMWNGIPDDVQFAIQSTRTAIVGIFCIEILLRVIADGKLLCNMYDILDIAMVLSAAVADVVWLVCCFL